MAEREQTPRRKPRFRERHTLREPQVVLRPVAVPAPPPPPAPRRRVDLGTLPVRVPQLSLEQALYVAIVLLGLAVRLWDVGSRAMHGDEAEHAWFAWHLYNGTGYQYDPVYHGPLQFIVTAGFFFLFGVSETTGRLMAVLFGAALVGLPYFLRPYMGRGAALLAAGYIAVSPAFVYVSRLERDDIFTCFFALVMAISLFSYVETRRNRWVYLGVAAAALSLTAMENTYITLFIFVTFTAIVVAAEFVGTRPSGDRLRAVCLRWGSEHGIEPPALAAVGALTLLLLVLTVVTGVYLPLLLLIALVIVGVVARQTLFESGTDAPFAGAILGADRPVWLNAATIVLAILFLAFSTFGTNLHGIWDAGQPLLNTHGACPGNPYILNPCRRDILGGLFYWLSQHEVHRGGQPWFYYSLLFGLYEQIAVVLGVGGILWYMRRPTLFTAFLTYWAVLSFGIYSWAGEKFPWLMIHPLLPFALIAAMFVADLLGAAGRRRWIIAVVAAALIVLEVHNAFEVNFVNGANPVEMMVYVQSAPDTPLVAQKILALSNKVTNGDDLHLTIDQEDTWPFAWYLRNMPNAAYPAYPQILQKPYSSNPAIIVDETHQQALAPALRGYTGHRYRLRWWFPEDYKQLTWASFGRHLVDPGYWRVVADWIIARRPFGPRISLWFYYYVKNGLASPY